MKPVIGDILKTILDVEEHLIKSVLQNMALLVFWSRLPSRLLSRTVLTVIDGTTNSKQGLSILLTHRTKNRMLPCFTALK